MGAVEKEKGVLKLVHPGRYVEIHREPIRASEVLKRNPRHSVARPDVFEYPWIVVRPESVLNLGRVFYIVPNSTIYKLIKSKGYSVQPSSQQNQPPDRYVHRQPLEHASPSKASAGVTPKHHEYRQEDWQQFQATGSEVASPLGERYNRPSQYESISDIITKYRSTYNEFKQMSVTASTSDIESPDDKEYNISEANSSKGKAPATVKQDDALGLRTEYKQQATILKPCLRKQDSARKLLHLQVSFSLPNESEERRRKVIDFRAE
ncbi:hypothetical protein PTKIN_Ptkin15bG0135800 [Pterospermum kingtungense]